jgi:hypothetical protein
MLNSNKIDLPCGNERAISQICQPERSLQRSGREQITHPTHGHDDIANAIAGVVDLVLNTSGGSMFSTLILLMKIGGHHPLANSAPPFHLKRTTARRNGTKPCLANRKPILPTSAWRICIADWIVASKMDFKCHMKMITLAERLLTCFVNS